MNWIPLTRPEQVAEIVERSHSIPQVIFKHSTRCGTSAMILSRLERSAADGHMDFYFLDLIRYRPISDQIAEQFGVFHESPQVLLIRNGECVYDESHMGISMDELTEQAAQ
jgi:bacillithiol system protein YtxJ